MSAGQMSALERSLCYRGFSEAFRHPSGGTDLLDESLIPQPTANAKAEFLAAFEPAASPSACSLYASTHLRREQSALFEELVRWYDFFGLQRKVQAELPDHISVELEFMHFLTYREHLAGCASPDYGSLRTAQKEFLQKHLVPFARVIASQSAGFAIRYQRLCNEAASFAEQHFLNLSET